MEKIEIQYNKKLLHPFMAVMATAFFGINYLTFFTDYYKQSNFIWTVMAVAVSLNVLYTINKLWKRIREDKSYIVLTEDAIIY